MQTGSPTRYCRDRKGLGHYFVTLRNISETFCDQTEVASLLGAMLKIFTQYESETSLAFLLKYNSLYMLNS